MAKIRLKFAGINDELLPGVKIIAEELNISLAEDGIEFEFKNEGNGINILFDGEIGSVAYGAPYMLARCIGLIAENIRKGESFKICETPAYDTLGVMLDCSRNAVFTMDTFKKITRKLALMGYSMIQLYTEDTYEMKEYPYFGYLRGRYSADELREMDEYAKLFGIELVPCIQTLAHLGTTLRWKEFEEVVDFEGILLVDEDKTYEMIECMFKTMSENLTSRRINIGLDEAHMVGLGKFLDKHGYQKRATIMMRHVNRVVEIARKYGYRPMMWSDMFFRMVNGGDYYAIKNPIDPEVVEKIPNDIDLVYWDYYNDDAELINGMMSRHKQITENVIFAGGAWKWTGFSPNSHFSEHVARAHHTGCRENGIRENFVTSWGDNGAFCSVFSILPALQQWAELCYKNHDEAESLIRRFETCVGGGYNDFMDLGLSVLTPDNPAPGKVEANPGTYILWQDVLYGLFDKHIDPDSYREHFGKCAEIFDKKLGLGGEWAYLFKTQRDFCRVLELKCAVGIELHAAYAAGDTVKLHELAGAVLPELKNRIESFSKSQREQWLLENKVFGLDSFDIRVGGLLRRVEIAILRVTDYLNGKLDKIEELEEKQLYYVPVNKPGEQVTKNNLWLKTATPSVIY